jgi:hypothetical protein
MASTSPIGSFSGNSREHAGISAKTLGLVVVCSRLAGPQTDRRAPAAVLWAAAGSVSCPLPSWPCWPCWPCWPSAFADVRRQRDALWRLVRRLPTISSSSCLSEGLQARKCEGRPDGRLALKERIRPDGENVSVGDSSCVALACPTSATSSATAITRASILPPAAHRRARRSQRATLRLRRRSACPVESGHAPPAPSAGAIVAPRHGPIRRSSPD